MSTLTETLRKISEIPATVNPAQKPGNAPRVPADALDAVEVIDGDNVVNSTMWGWSYDREFLTLLERVFQGWTYSDPRWVEFHQLERCQAGYVFVTPAEAAELTRLVQAQARAYRAREKARRAAS